MRSKVGGQDPGFVQMPRVGNYGGRLVGCSTGFGTERVVRVVYARAAIFAQPAARFGHGPEVIRGVGRVVRDVVVIELVRFRPAVVHENHRWTLLLHLGDNIRPAC